MADRESTLWTCPTCGRQFTKTKQWHSCRVRSVDDHFRGKDQRLKRTFEALIARLRRVGPLRVDAVRSSINLVSKYHFGGIVVRRDYLRVGFLSDSVIEDPRIVRMERIAPNRIGHFVVLRDPRDADDRLIGWLRAAHSLQDGTRPGSRG